MIRSGTARLAVLLWGTCVIGHASPGRAEPARTCTVLTATPEGAYVVVIGTDTCVAVPVSAARQALVAQADLKDCQARAALAARLIAQYQTTASYYDSTLASYRAYIAELEHAVRGYKQLAQDYKRLSGGPRASLDLGVGVTGGDQKPAVLAGLAVGKFRAWAFLQEKNAGGAVGASFPIF